MPSANRLHYEKMPEQAHVAVKVWDLPVRLVHWAFVALLVFQFVSGKVGGELIAWHLYSGYAMLALVVFRILWGFAGSTHARFASFLAGPVAGWRFARRLFSREAVPQVGHNPLGGWMVIALVACLGVQAVSGLFSNDGVATAGPLAALTSLETSNDFSEVHRGNFKVLLVLSGLHIAAVIFHWLAKKENLTKAMFTGVKRVPEEVLRQRREARRDAPPRRVASRERPAGEFPGPWRSALLLALSVCVVALVVFLGPG
jgi:cytochrome b